MTSFADHIRENPVFLSLLKMLERHGCKLRAPKPASEEYGDYGVVAFTSHLAAIKDREEPLALLARQPVTEAYAMFLRSFHPADSGGQIRTQQPGICRFVRYAHDLTDDQIEEIGRDPFLIAYAMSGGERCVVTTEVSAPSKKKAEPQNT